MINWEVILWTCVTIGVLVGIFGIILTDAVYLRGIFTVDDDKVGAEVVLHFSEIRAQIGNACLPDDISDCKYFHRYTAFLSHLPAALETII